MSLLVILPTLTNTQKDWIKRIIYAVSKWIFTWVIASIPVIFYYFKQYIFPEPHNVLDIHPCAEYFIISIVMVTEPLRDIVMSSYHNTISLWIALFIVMIVVSAAYFFCLAELKPELTLNKPPEQLKHVAEHFRFAARLCFWWSAYLGMGAIVHNELLHLRNS